MSVGLLGKIADARAWMMMRRDLEASMPLRVRIGPATLEFLQLRECWTDADLLGMRVLVDPLIEGFSVERDFSHPI